LVGFLLPALIFVLSIPRAQKFRMPRGERHFDRNIFLSFGWLVLIFFLVAIEVLLWIIIVFSLAGPMMAGAMDKGIKDLRILRKVKKGSLKPQQTRYALALTMIGTFEPSPGQLAEKVITDICYAPTATEAQDKLHQLLNRQGLYGIQVGAPVVFYLGAYAYALFDASSRLGDNDTAHAIAFGIWYGVIVLTATACCAVLGMSSSATLESVFGGRSNGSQRHATYETVWLWNRGRCVRSWSDNRIAPAQAPINESIRHILKGRANRLSAAALSIVTIAIVCSFAITISYYTPTLGFGCRATTVMCYGGCQVILIPCWIYYNEDEQNPWVRWSVYSLGMICWVFSMFISIGGSVMQLLGVYRNCICKAGLKYWLNTAGVMVELAVDTQDHRDSGYLWFRVGVAALAFIGGFSFLGWGYHMRMKAKLMEQINKLR
jgi:hypothetical protein